MPSSMRLYKTTLKDMETYSFFLLILNRYFLGGNEQPEMFALRARVCELKFKRENKCRKI